MDQNNDPALSNEAVQALAATIHSDGWQKVIKPGLSALSLEHTHALIDGNVRDPKGNLIPDDTIRAVIKIANWVLRWEQDLAATQRDLLAAQTRAPKEFSGGSPLAEQPSLDES